ncbi:hypothetical protein [Actinocrispum wychmicini]|uniref:Uncharacterized protein n=1 Tax=Actinocrispum wychmicini TaxID=1213861 RepID=A0A4R2JCL1_9PSEU|nr:hypothetical protein [Actinocrispum wychmicini]TCO55762.1 hypothetical protein EV192_107185 [Actinocrispum wychmicini]
MTDQDVLVAVSFWRLNESAAVADEQARTHGAKVFAITDTAQTKAAIKRPGCDGAGSNCSTGSP